MPTAMRFQTNNSPEGTGVYVWISRVRQVAGTGSREISYLSRWPATLAPISKDVAIAQGFEDATHVILGPAWRGRLIQPSDVITRIAGRKSGRDYVRANKNWSVNGRHIYMEDGERSYQIAYVREPI